MPTVANYVSYLIWVILPTALVGVLIATTGQWLADATAARTARKGQAMDAKPADLMRRDGAS